MRYISITIVFNIIVRVLCSFLRSPENSVVDPEHEEVYQVRTCYISTAWEELGYEKPISGLNLQLIVPH